MKALLTIAILLCLLFSSCRKCYQCWPNTSGTPVGLQPLHKCFYSNQELQKFESDNDEICN